MSIEVTPRPVSLSSMSGHYAPSLSSPIQSLKNINLNSIGTTPLTVESLLTTNPIKFVPERVSSKDETIEYKAINEKAETPSKTLPSKGSPKFPKKELPEDAESEDSAFPPIDPSAAWPRVLPAAAGMQNIGNTCYLNSSLQILVHTPPLARYLFGSGGKSHGNISECTVVQKNGFCMACAMKSCLNCSYSDRSHYTPKIITGNLRKIAPHFRMFRQEDAHEFLRFCVDSLQTAALFGTSPKLPHPIRHTSYVHQVFGGQLRSRVSCLNCGYNSDTFDAMLDLSLDIMRVDSLKSALEGFIKIDELKGGNKYKCEKCKKLVNAEKQMRIEKAPMVLTVHLKRFRPDGRKNGDMIKYPATLNLRPYMCDSSLSPTYDLYGIIHHSGSSPNSGHYTSSVKSSSGQWYHMNDDMASKINPPMSSKNAYVLCYIRSKGEGLRSILTKAAAQDSASVSNHGTPKRTRDEESVLTPQSTKKFKHVDSSPLSPSTTASQLEELQHRKSPFSHNQKKKKMKHGKGRYGHHPSSLAGNMRPRIIK